MTEIQTQPSPTMDFVVSELRKDPGISFADLRDRAAAHGITVYPIVYGRAKALLGLVPMKPRGQGKQARATAARKAVDRQETRAVSVPAPLPPTEAHRRALRSTPSHAPRPGDRLDDMVGEFRRMAEDRERYREALERIQAVLTDVLR